MYLYLIVTMGNILLLPLNGGKHPFDQLLHLVEQPAKSTFYTQIPLAGLADNKLFINNQTTVTH